MLTLAPIACHVEPIFSSFIFQYRMFEYTQTQKISSAVTMRTQARLETRIPRILAGSRQITSDTDREMYSVLTCGEIMAEVCQK